MPKLFNTVTKKFMHMPDSYVGKFPFITEEEAAELAQPIVVEVEEPAKPKKKKAEYKADAIDADGDGRVQAETALLPLTLHQRLAQAVAAAAVKVRIVQALVVRVQMVAEIPGQPRLQTAVLAAAAQITMLLAVMAALVFALLDTGSRR